MSSKNTKDSSIQEGFIRPKISLTGKKSIRNYQLLINFWNFRSEKLKKPLFLIDINLAIPHVQFVPSLDELQQVLNKAARYIVETGKSITAWGQHRIHKVAKLNEYGEEIEVVEDIPSENLQNWYPVIQSNKGIIGGYTLDFAVENSAAACISCCWI